MSERANAHPVFLPTELYMGLVKKMAAFEIGKSAAILDGLNEDLHKEGFIDDDTYEKFRSKYRRKLINVVREKQRQKPAAIPCDSEKIQIQKTLVMVNEQWDIHGSEWQQRWIEKAKQLKEIPEALEILRKAGVLDE